MAVVQSDVNSWWNAPGTETPAGVYTPSAANQSAAVPTWQQNVDSWLTSNPNATASEISAAATAGGGSYDPVTGRFSVGNTFYKPQTVSDVYQNVLGRTAEAEGLNYWQDRFGKNVDASELAQFKQAAMPELLKEPTWQQKVDTYLASAPNADASAISAAAQGSGGSYDPATKTFSYFGEAYTPQANVANTTNQKIASYLRNYGDDPYALAQIAKTHNVSLDHLAQLTGKTASDLNTSFYNAGVDFNTAKKLGMSSQGALSQLANEYDLGDFGHTDQTLSGLKESGLQKLQDVYDTQVNNYFANWEGGAPAGIDRQGMYTSATGNSRPTSYAFGQYDPVNPLPYDQNTLIKEAIDAALSGEQFGVEDLGLFQRYNEIVPNNPAASQIASQWDSIYGTKTNKQMYESLGNALKLTPEEVDKVARLQAAKNYKHSLDTGGEPFNLGATPLSQQYADTLLKYASTKYGKPLPDTLTSKVRELAGQADSGLKSAREIQSKTPSFFQDMIGPAAMMASVIPGGQLVALALQAANTVANHGNIGDFAKNAALSYGLGQIPGLGGLSEGVATSLDIPQQLANSLVSGGLKTIGGLASGKEFEDALTGGAVGGLNSYLNFKV